MSAKQLYASAVAWIAANDAPKADASPRSLAGYMTVSLTADTFGKAPIDVARDVWRLRGLNIREGEIRVTTKATGNVKKGTAVEVLAIAEDGWMRVRVDGTATAYVEISATERVA